MSHTPGPWAVDGEDTSSVSGCVVGYYVNAPGEGGGRVGQTFANCMATTQDALANARLMAAAPDLLAPARELLFLYDWRPELARLEKDPDADPKVVKRLLREYGDRKKAGWIALRIAIAKAEPHPEYPQHCTTPEPCIAAGRCTRDPNCID